MNAMTVVKKSKEKKLSTCTFHKSSVIIEDDFVILKFPKNILDYLNCDGKIVNWIPINGIIQLSGHQPNITIPLFNKDDFIHKR